MRQRHLTLLVTNLFLLLGGCTVSGDEPSFPEREFDNHEAYQIMEQLAADAVAELPDFPGFEQRKGSFLECEEKGVVYDDWVSIELRYTFSPSDASTELVRTQYTDIWLESWSKSGYQVHSDEWNADTSKGSIEATGPGGITLWWWVAEGAALTIQSGCVPVGDGQRVTDYLPPAGGVTSENDLFGRKLNDAPTDVADDEESDEAAAVNPFDGLEAAAAPPGTNPFHHQL